MEIRLSTEAHSDLQYLKSHNNSKLLKRIRRLLESIIVSPYTGLGKPEPLKHGWKGKWSRRIDKENRIIYEVFEDHINVLSLLGHYI